MNTFSKRIVWFVVFFCMIVGWWVKGQTAVSAQNLPSPHTPTAPTSEPPAVYLEQWGSNGTGAGQFSQPYAVETDADGNIFVADRGNDRIQKFDADGTFITQWGSSGSGVTQFSLIIDIAVSPYGYVYVTDFGNDRVTMFDNDGIYIYSWAWGNGALVNPRGITVDHWGNVFVVDGGNDRVIKFDAGGDYILEWGTSGTSNGQFNNPAGIAVDSTGRVFVSDTTNDNIQAFDNNGVYKDKWGSTGTGDGQFNYPYSLAIDGDDSVYVIDATNANIQRFNNGGAHLANWGTSGSGNGQLNSPFGIEIEANGNILVADSNNNRIQRFRPPVIRRCNVVIGNTYEFSHVQAMFTEVSDRSYLTHWSPDGVFEISTGIAVDNDDEVFILVRPFTSTFYQVQKFDLAGNFITQWGSPNGTVAAFSNPEGITTDGAGNV